MQTERGDEDAEEYNEKGEGGKRKEVDEEGEWATKEKRGGRKSKEGGVELREEYERKERRKQRMRKKRRKSKFTKQI